jgi:hypothetical protein
MSPSSCCHYQVMTVYMILLYLFGPLQNDIVRIENER